MMRRIGHVNRRVFASTASSGPPFDGIFSALFASPYQFMQADRGLSYGSTPLPTAGNTSVTAMTIGGTSPNPPVPVLVKAENTATVGSGATFSIYYDGTGVTPAMTGVALTATPTALTGAGTNLTLAASVAASVANDTWKATAASNSDQSGNSLPYSQSDVTAQPIITAGANGHVALLFDGVNDFYGSSLNSVAGMQMWLVVKQVAFSANTRLVCSGTGLSQQILYQAPSSSNLTLNNAVDLLGGALAIGSVGRVHAKFNTTNSEIKVGNNALVSGTIGTTGLGTGRGIACDRFNATPLVFSKIEVYALGYMPAQSFSVADARANSYWGGVVI